MGQVPEFGGRPHEQFLLGVRQRHQRLVELARLPQRERLGHKLAQLFDQSEKV